MKISKMIAELEEIMRELGDLDVKVFDNVYSHDVTGVIAALHRTGNEAWIASESLQIDAHRNSPEYKERERLYQEKQRIRKVTLEGALLSAPAVMTCRDPQEWERLKELNSKDGYSHACCTYAERWARVMEGRIAHGGTIADSAETASYLADEEGITGFMYGAAVGMLARVWIHGEELRCWHNKETQIHDEGYLANETGGVLNPALLTMEIRRKVE